MRVVGQGDRDTLGFFFFFPALLSRSRETGRVTGAESS